MSKMLEDLKAALKEADLHLPVCIDDHICVPGDGDGKWFIYDSSFNDGPPFAEFYNAKSDAMLVATLLNLLPRLIAVLEWMEERIRTIEGFHFAADDQNIGELRALEQLLTKLEGK